MNVCDVERMPVAGWTYYCLYLCFVSRNFEVWWSVHLDTGPRKTQRRRFHVENRDAQGMLNSSRSSNIFVPHLFATNCILDFGTCRLISWNKHMSVLAIFSEIREPMWQCGLPCPDVPNILFFAIHVLVSSKLMMNSNTEKTQVFMASLTLMMPASIGLRK